MENDPSQCFFTGAENCIRAGAGAPFARRKEQHHILYRNEHVTMTVLLTSGSTIPYLCRTHCPTQAGHQNEHRPHPTEGRGRNDDSTTDQGQQAPLHRGGRGRGQIRPDGESNKAKQDNYPVD